MSRSFVMLAVVVGLITLGGVAHAQDQNPGAGRVEILVNPVGGTFWSEGRSAGGGPDFDQYQTAVSLTYNFNRHVASRVKLPQPSGSTRRSILQIKEVERSRARLPAR